MAAPHRSPYDFQFEKLMRLGGASDEGTAVFAELLRHRHAIHDPLSDFIIRQPNTPELAVLIDLLAKCMDERSLPLLMRFCDIHVPELRRAAANALGWFRCRAAIERLDRMEGEDADNAVREEARAAIDEILEAYPGLSSLLHHHRPAETGANSAGMRARLVAALPRILAIRHRAFPIRIDDAGTLHIAVPAGSERRQTIPLPDVTGMPVEVASWPEERIVQSIEHLYGASDDEFVQHAESLTETARRELRETILGEVRTGEPVGPLDEANDAVEAAQSFLASFCSLALAAATVTAAHGEMAIAATTRNGGELDLEPPAEHLRERFVALLRFLAPDGTIRCSGPHPLALTLLARPIDGGIELDCTTTP